MHGGYAGCHTVLTLQSTRAEARVKAGSMPISSKLVQELREMAASGPQSTPNLGRGTHARPLASASAQPGPVPHGRPSRMMKPPEELPLQVQLTVLPTQPSKCN